MGVAILGSAGNILLLLLSGVVILFVVVVVYCRSAPFRSGSRVGSGSKRTSCRLAGRPEPVGSYHVDPCFCNT